MHLPDCFLEESEARVPSMMEACRPGDALSFYARKPMYFSTGRCKVTVLGFGYQIYQSQILHGICNFWHAAIEAIWQLNAFPSNHEFITHHPVVQDLASQAPLEILQESVRIYIVLPKSISFSWNWSDLNLWIYFSEVNIRMSVRPGDDLQVHVFENLVPWTILIWIHLLQTSASCHLAFT